MIHCSSGDGSEKYDQLDQGESVAVKIITFNIKSVIILRVLVIL